MIFVRTIIENFFSISDQLTWEMENQGLVLISGENNDSQAADSNGAGKSTLFEALVWCLWGKTTRGQIGDGVINRKAEKNCKVMVWVRHEKELYYISRHRKHDTDGNNVVFHRLGPQNEPCDLTQGTSTLTQSKIDAFLGIDYDTFIQGPMIPQGHFKKFSEMSDGEQKAIFDRALQTGVLAVALKETNDRIAGASQKLSHNSSWLEKTKAEITTIQGTIEKYQIERSTWDRSKRQALCEVAKEIVAIVEQQEALWEQSQAVNFDQAIVSSKAEATRLRADRDRMQREWSDSKSEIKESLAEVRVQWKDLSAKVRNLQNEIRNMEELKDATCPTCGQEVTVEHVATCLEESKKDLIEKSSQSSKLAKQIEALEGDLAAKENAHNQVWSDILSHINTREAVHLKLVDDASAAKAWVNELAALHRQEHTLRGLFKKKQDEVTPFDDMIEYAEKEMLQKQKDLASIRATVRRYQIELENLQFWQYGFSNKGLKSHILASVTPFLNERVEHHIKALAGGELSVEFSTQTTLKSGETREKFSVQVTNLRGADSYAGNSGGEKGRADLAINFVLSDLMSSRSRCPYPQRFLDEPFENLDESGIEAVMELLSDMAVGAGSIFVITHLDSMKGLFSKTLKLVKQGGLTTLEAA
jgi:DNA repair exonuclease SbcCD ATPase subunit